MRSNISLRYNKPCSNVSLYTYNNKQEVYLSKAQTNNCNNNLI